MEHEIKIAVFTLINEINKKGKSLLQQLEVREYSLKSVWPRAKNTSIVMGFKQKFIVLTLTELKDTNLTPETYQVYWNCIIF